MNRRFFLDTADPNFVENARRQLRGIAGPKNFLGVTTNPKAIAGICLTQNSARRTIDELAARISEMKGDSDGQLFIQIPGSRAPFETMVEFIEHCYNWGRPNVKLGFKLPHFRVAEVSDRLSDWSSLLNVTGVTDSQTVGDCIKYPVAYISLLTGRMEERGIDAKAHVRQSKWWFHTAHPVFQGFIAGSMRTVEQLEWCWEAGMIPTIGRSLWADIEKNDAWRLFQLGSPADNTNEPVILSSNSIPAPKEQQLSQEFFDEMDGWSAKSAESFIWG